MEHDREEGEELAKDLESLAAEHFRNGMPPPEIEAILVERGLSREMAATVVKGVVESSPRAERSFSNLHLDLWRVVRSNPVLFIIVPVVAWYPFDLFAEYIAQAASRDFLSQLRVYSRLNQLGELLVGTWVAAVVFNEVRRLATGSPATLRFAILDGTRQYGRFLKTAWSVAWRVGVGTILLVIPGIVLSVWYSLAMPVTVFEGPSGGDAVRASRELMRGRSWRLIWCLLGFSLVYLPWCLAASWFLPATGSVPLNALTDAPFSLLISLWSIWLALVYVDATGNRQLAPPVGNADLGSAGSGAPRDSRKGRRRLAAVSGLGVLVMVFSLVTTPELPLFKGTRITFGDDQQHAIYYDDDVDQADAWLMGDALVNLGWFNGEFPMAVRLGSDGSSYWLYFYIEKEILSNVEAMESLRAMERYLGEVMQKPTHILMLLPSFTGDKEIPVSRWARQETSWVRGPDSARTSPVRPMSDVMISSRPILQSATANPDVSKWLNEWTAECGTFFPWSFEFLDVQKRSLDPARGREFSLLAEGDALEALRSTLEWSPSHDFALNMFVHNLGRRGSSWSLSRVEPEQWLYLFRVADGRGWPVLILGPSALLHAIGWTDERTAVALGIAPGDSVDCLYIWRMQIGDSTVTVERHRGPAVTATQRLGLAERWRAWVASHYSEVEWAAD